MLRSNSKVWGIHVVSPEEERKATVGRICRNGYIRSGCPDKHNHMWCNSNLGPLTLQSDALTTRPLLSLYLH